MAEGGGDWGLEREEERRGRRDGVFVPSHASTVVNPVGSRGSGGVTNWNQAVPGHLKFVVVQGAQQQLQSTASEGGKD